MSEESTLNILKKAVGERYGVAAEHFRVVRSPYRICPLGAHVDHQLGQVTAMALDRGVVLVYAPSGTTRVQLSSLDFPGKVEFSLGQVSACRAGDWGNYARGAVLALQQRYPVSEGIVGMTAGRLGEGGLSSSAAVGVAYLLALEEANGLQVTPQENIALDQQIENAYLGLRNGILDQAAILLSRRDCLTHIDCRTMGHELIRRPGTMAEFAILIAFSGLKQALVSTDYNRRVEECSAAAAILLQATGRAAVQPLLGNLSAEEYQAHRGILQGAEARRAAHFFSEVDRVAQGVSAWRQGALNRFGALMTASGQSSIRHYECGCDPLIALFEIMVATEGVYGGRFSGAGFRGCCVALVDPQAADQTAEKIRREYAARYPELAEAAPVLICEAADGARIL